LANLVNTTEDTYQGITMRATRSSSKRLSAQNGNQADMRQVYQQTVANLHGGYGNGGMQPAQVHHPVVDFPSNGFLSTGQHDLNGNGTQDHAGALFAQGGQYFVTYGQPSMDSPGQLGQMQGTQPYAPAASQHQVQGHHLGSFSGPTDHHMHIAHNGSWNPNVPMVQATRPQNRIVSGNQRPVQPQGQPMPSRIAQNGSPNTQIAPRFTITPEKLTELLDEPKVGTGAPFPSLFGSYEEALDAKKKILALKDDIKQSSVQDFPDTQEGVVHLVERLYNAITNMLGIIDNPRKVQPNKGKGRKNKQPQAQKKGGIVPQEDGEHEEDSAADEQEPEYTDGPQAKHVQSLSPVEVEILSWEVVVSFPRCARLWSAAAMLTHLQVMAYNVQLGMTGKAPWEAELKPKGKFSTFMDRFNAIEECLKVSLIRTQLL
jgi:hypothetical protein